MKEKLLAGWRRLTHGKDTRIRWWLLLGVAGILLIGLSEWIPRSGEKTQETATVAVTPTQVEQALEQRIAALLSSMDGVGSCRVMVTLESTSQSVYAAKAATDSSGGYSEEVLVVSTDAGPAGLLLTTLQPAVKGVAVVCDGGKDPAVCQRVMQVVSTAFHISERRVCVVAQE